MRNSLIAFASAASLCALATAASAQDYYPYQGPPTVPSETGAPLYSYHNTAPQPGIVGSCEVISGNRVCSGSPAEFDTSGPVALLGAPFVLVAAPFGGFANGGTYAPTTGAPAYSYESHVPPRPGAVGYCDLISGNRVCFP